MLIPSAALRDRKFILILASASLSRAVLQLIRVRLSVAEGNKIKFEFHANPFGCAQGPEIHFDFGFSFAQPSSITIDTSSAERRTKELISNFPSAALRDRRFILILASASLSRAVLQLIRVRLRVERKN